MFTVKLYSNNGGKMKILSCESVTSYAWDHGTSFQLKLHQKDQNLDYAYNVGNADGCDRKFAEGDDSIWWECAIIENAAGKTTQIISYGGPGNVPVSRPPNPLSADNHSCTG